MIGAGSKAGLVPLHVWLPLAHPAAPSHVSALMSGVMTKVAVYGFVRIVFDLMGEPAWWWSMVVLALGGITAVMGVLYALMQHDLKRLLAYHTVENIGIIFIGLGLALAFKAHGMTFAAALALTAGLLHVFNHSVFKSLLFFGSGAVLTATGERDMEHLGGLIHRMPQTAFVFLVGCVAISALPPLNGFVSEWLTFQAILLSPQLPSWGLKFLVPAVGALLALSAALAAACFVKAFGVTFLGRPRTPAAERATETDRWSLAAMYFLAALCLVAGVLPGLFIDALAPLTDALVGGRMPVQAGEQWLSIVPIAESRSSYNGLLVFLFMVISGTLAAVAIHRLASDRLRRAPAWDCGYPDPSPATQYTASSFAQPIRRVFGTARVRRARACRDAAARRHAAGAHRRRSARPDLGRALRADRGRRRHCRGPPQPSAVPDHPPVPQPRLRRPRHPAAGARHMALILDLAVQAGEMLLVLLLAPLLTGFVRKVKARLLRRQGPPLLQPYLDLVRLMRKEVVLADNASWLFRVIPYLIFAATWVAASLVPTFRTGLLFSWSADLIVIIALLGNARFFLALAGLDVGTSFGGIGSSREVMIASLAEPAMIMIVFTVALIAGSTQLSTIADFMSSPAVGLRVSLALGAARAHHGGDRRERTHSGRQSGDAPRTDHGARGHGAGIFRPPPGADRALGVAQAHALRLADRLPVRALGHAAGRRRSRAGRDRRRGLSRQARRRRLPARAVRDLDRQDARVPRAGVPRRGADARPAGDAAALRIAEPLMRGIDFDIAHLLAGSLVLVSFMQLYQDRLYALLNVFALHALVLALSVAWQAFIQDAPHLYVTAAIALVFKAIVIPVVLHRIIVRLGIHREIEKVVGVGPTMLAGIGLVALSMVVMLRVTQDADPLAREDLAFALSVVLLGLLMMVTRRNAVSQVVGFMSLENGLVLAATGAKGMPLVVEISVAFSILIAFIVIGIFLFRIRERFDTVDLQALDRFRGERR